MGSVLRWCDIAMNWGREIPKYRNPAKALREAKAGLPHSRPSTDRHSRGRVELTLRLLLLFPSERAMIAPSKARLSGPCQCGYQGGKWKPVDGQESEDAVAVHDGTHALVVSGLTAKGSGQPRSGRAREGLLPSRQQPPLATEDRHRKRARLNGAARATGAIARTKSLRHDASEAPLRVPGSDPVRILCLRMTRT